jgi:antitoxin component YwqK of YwqJK toxin-antitoxin module
MKINFLILALFVVFPSIADSQTGQPVNQTDNNGRETGYRVKKEGNIKIYEGYFQNGHPVGEFKRYYPDNTLKSLLVYSDDGSTADATFYHHNGFVASQGKYVNQKKEGKWKFYSSMEKDYLLSEEEYTGNLKNGQSVKFYPGGAIAEKISYVNGAKQGEWLQYYPDGTLNLKTNYTNDKLNGSFDVWFANGKPEIKGNYRNDRKNGHWMIYREDGTVRYEIDYVNGFTKDRKISIDESNYIDSLEKNINKIPDPEQTGELW